METMTAATGTQLRDQALVDVAVNADPDWWQHAVNIVRDIAATSFDFTTDDIWCELERRSIATPHEPRAIGAVVVAVKRLRVNRTNEPVSPIE
jgi:hypothetical protein